jgi:hypothetical protein
MYRRVATIMTCNYYYYYWYYIFCDFSEGIIILHPNATVKVTKKMIIASTTTASENAAERYIINKQKCIIFKNTYNTP